MAVLQSLIGKRHFLTSMLLATIGVVPVTVAMAQPGGDTSIRPFKFHASDASLADLRRFGSNMSIERPIPSSNGFGSTGVVSLH